MNRENVKKFQNIQLEILNLVVDLCKKINVTYYLGFGTLLGAIRHKGFIPWDPDVDIMMYRTDYEIFCNYCESNSISPLFIDTLNTDKNHLSPHAIVRLKGTHVFHKNHTIKRFKSEHDEIYIDVFPIDNVPDDAIHEKKQIKELNRIERVLTLKQAPIYIGKTGKLKKIAKLAASYLLEWKSINSLVRKRDDIMKRYDLIFTNKVTTFADPSKWDPQKLQFDREWIGCPVSVEFEGRKYNAPNDFDGFLKKRYGDYMNLPPEDQRWRYLDEAIDYVDYGDFENKTITFE